MLSKSNPLKEYHSKGKRISNNNQKNKKTKKERNIYGEEEKKKKRGKKKQTQHFEKINSNNKNKKIYNVRHQHHIIFPTKQKAKIKK